LSASRVVSGERPVHRELEREIASFVATTLGQAVTEQELLDKLMSDRPFVYLAAEVEPGKAREITERFPEIGSEDRELRRYPGKTLAANIVGVANWRADERKLHLYRESFALIVDGVDEMRQHLLTVGDGAWRQRSRRLLESLDELFLGACQRLLDLVEKTHVFR